MTSKQSPVLQILFVILLGIYSSNGYSATEKQTVYVGGYLFSPYVELVDGENYAGLTIKMIQALNLIQSNYDFKFVPTSIEKRHQAFHHGRFDMVLFESPQWGWLSREVNFIPLPIYDGEPFIALAKNAQAPNYFHELGNKNIILVKGYHYAMTQWQQVDAGYSENMRLVKSTKAAIESILKSRGDIAPVTYSYLMQYLKRNPSKRKLLRISGKWDQTYQHSVVLKKDANIQLTELQGLIKQLINSGVLANLAQEYDLPTTAK